MIKSIITRTCLGSMNCSRESPLVDDTALLMMVLSCSRLAFYLWSALTEIGSGTYQLKIACCMHRMRVSWDLAPNTKL